MVAARATATTNTDLETLVRVEVGDPATDRAAIAITNTRFTSTQVLSALKHATMYLQRENRLISPADALIYTDGTYTAGALSVAVPGAGYFDPIVKIENIADPLRPIRIPSLPLDEIEQYAVGSQGVAYPYGQPYRCALIDSDLARHVMIRPRPVSSLAIRAWRIAPPMIWASGDANEQASHWEDLLILLAAQELVGRREGMSEDQNARLAMVLKQYRQAANRLRQSQRIGRTRQGRS